MIMMTAVMMMVVVVVMVVTMIARWQLHRFHLFLLESIDGQLTEDTTSTGPLVITLKEQETC